jgi:hypothetical protein
MGLFGLSYGLFPCSLQHLLGTLFRFISVLLCLIRVHNSDPYHNEKKNGSRYFDSRKAVCVFALSPSFLLIVLLM